MDSEGQLTSAISFLKPDKKRRKRLQMASIRVVDDGAPPIVEKGRETPFKQGEFYVFDVEDDVARYWNKLALAKRAELSKQSRKTNKDLRLILDPFVHKPRTMK